MEVISDYILYWVRDPVANLSVLLEEIILLIHLCEPALELCRLSNLRVDAPNVALETVCILSLPEPLMSASLRWTTCFGEHPGHALFSRGRHPPKYPPPPLALRHLDKTDTERQGCTSTLAI
jgi:hypothetical protein